MRIAISTCVTAIVLFFFGFLWWGVLFAIVRPAEVIQNSALLETMDAALPDSAVYFYPDYGTPSEEPVTPWAILYFQKTAPSMGSMMGMGFVHMLLSALMASVGVSILANPSFARRVAVVIFLGLFVAVWADIGNMIWWRYPIGWTCFHFAYDVLSWVLAGLIIAAIVKPPADRS